MEHGKAGRVVGTKGTMMGQIKVGVGVGDKVVPAKFKIDRIFDIVIFVLLTLYSFFRFFRQRAALPQSK